MQLPKNSQPLCPSHFRRYIYLTKMDSQFTFGRFQSIFPTHHPNPFLQSTLQNLPAYPRQIFQGIVVGFLASMTGLMLGWWGPSGSLNLEHGLLLCARWHLLRIPSIPVCPRKKSRLPLQPYKSLQDQVLSTYETIYFLMSQFKFFSPYKVSQKIFPPKIPTQPLSVYIKVPRRPISCF